MIAASLKPTSVRAGAAMTEETRNKRTVRGKNVILGTTSLLGLGSGPPRV